jgi:predicted porin
MATKIVACSLGCLLALGAGSASAIDDIRINGFLTASGSMNDSKQDNWYANDRVLSAWRFDTGDTRLGLQVAADINERIGATAQLLAKGGRDNFNVDLDWGYVSYQAADPLAVRAGKVKLPTFLVSDYIEVGYAYPWIRPPQEVYILNPITSIAGVDLLYRPNIGDFDLLIQPYFGTESDEAFVNPAFVEPGIIPGLEVGDQVNFDAEQLIGVNASFGNDIFSVRAGYLQTKVSSDFAEPVGLGFRNETAKFWSLGFNMDWHNFIAYAEYAERDEDGLAEAAFPDQKSYYGTLGYRIGRFLPHITYAVIDEGQDIPEVPGFGAFETAVLKQESWTGGLRYELTDGAALKVEVQYVKPDEDNGVVNFGLFDKRLNVVDPGTDDAMMYSVAFDVIF